MQGDLISRSELINKMTEAYKKHYAGDVSASGFTIAMEMVRNQPTAYDVEKVIEEIEDIIEEPMLRPSDIVWNNAINMCLEVVRNGGKE